MFARTQFSSATVQAQTLDWRQETPTTRPPARHLHGLAYDAARQRAVLFGGSARSGFLQDTLTYGPVGFTPYGDGCGDPAVTLSPR